MTLERQAVDANQNLKAAARVKKPVRLAKPLVPVSSLLSILGSDPRASRSRLRRSSSRTARRSRRRHSGEPRQVPRAKSDLFGCVSSTFDAAKTDTQQSESLYRSVLLTLRADVAQNYFALRELDGEAQVLADVVALRDQALKLVQRRYAEGDIGKLDVVRAASELETTRSDAMTVQRLRAASEHSLAILLGRAPA